MDSNRASRPPDNRYTSSSYDGENRYEGPKHGSRSWGNNKNNYHHHRGPPQGRDGRYHDANQNYGACGPSYHPYDHYNSAPPYKSSACRAPTSSLYMPDDTPSFQTPPPSHPPRGSSPQHHHFGTNSVSQSLPPTRDGGINQWRTQTRSIAHYKRIEQIGEGTYGQVYKAKCLATGRTVALKKIRLTSVSFEGLPRTVIREIKILKALRHENMVEMVEVVSSKGYEHLDEEDSRENRGSRDRHRDKKESKHSRKQREDKDKKEGIINTNTSTNSRHKKDSSSTNNSSSRGSTSKKDRTVECVDREKYVGNLFLVLEYVSHDLSGILDMGYRFSPVQSKCIFRQLMDVLRYMHSNKYVHRDLKSSNILIDDNFRVKLADFGLARSIAPPLFQGVQSIDGSNSQEFTTKVVTLWYKPPELLLGETRYDEKIDIWSAGCILAEILVGKAIFPGKDEAHQLTLIFETMGTPRSGSWDEYHNLPRVKSGSMDVPRPIESKFREKYGKHKNMTSSALSLIERLLEHNPKKRLRAEAALDSNYFLSNPVAPERPEDLGSINLGGDSHEFQTRQIRRGAKAHAQRAGARARASGMGNEKAVYEKAYNDFLKDAASDRKAMKSNNSLTPTTGHNAFVHKDSWSPGPHGIIGRKHVKAEHDAHGKYDKNSFHRREGDRNGDKINRGREERKHNHKHRHNNKERHDDKKRHRNNDRENEVESGENEKREAEIQIVNDTNIYEKEKVEDSLQSLGKHPKKDISTSNYESLEISINNENSVGKNAERHSQKLHKNNFDTDTNHNSTADKDSNKDINLDENQISQAQSTIMDGEERRRSHKDQDRPSSRSRHSRSKEKDGSSERKSSTDRHRKYRSKSKERNISSSKASQDKSWSDRRSGERPKERSSRERKSRKWDQTGQDRITTDWDTDNNKNDKRNYVHPGHEKNNESFPSRQTLNQHEWELQMERELKMEKEVSRRSNSPYHFTNNRAQNFNNKDKSSELVNGASNHKNVTNLDQNESSQNSNGGWGKLESRVAGGWGASKDLSHRNWSNSNDNRNKKWNERTQRDRKCTDASGETDRRSINYEAYERNRFGYDGNMNDDNCYVRKQNTVNHAANRNQDILRQGPYRGDRFSRADNRDNSRYAPYPQSSGRNDSRRSNERNIHSGDFPNVDPSHCHHDRSMEKVDTSWHEKGNQDIRRGNRPEYRHFSRNG